MPCTATIDSPVGPIRITGTRDVISEVMLGSDTRFTATPALREDSAELADAITQLQAYFAGELQHFELPLDMSRGTTFQQSVWRALLGISYGTTASYRDIAQTIHSPRAVRAVGSANGRNPLAIVVPCHRIIGSTGKLTGYAGGLAAKRWLLKFEAANIECSAAG